MTTLNSPVMAMTTSQIYNVLSDRSQNSRVKSATFKSSQYMKKTK